MHEGASGTVVVEPDHDVSVNGTPTGINLPEAEPGEYEEDDFLRRYGKELVETDRLGPFFLARGVPKAEDDAWIRERVAWYSGAIDARAHSLVTNLGWQAAAVDVFHRARPYVEIGAKVGNANPDGRPRQAPPAEELWREMQEEMEKVRRKMYPTEASKIVARRYDLSPRHVMRLTRPLRTT